MKVGPNVVRNPAFLVGRSQQDHVTWVDESAIRRKIAEFNGHVDDYELGGN